MAILQVLQYPDPRLKLVAKHVESFDAVLQQTCADLYATMYHHEGVGLAATQVNLQQRILVIDLSETRTQPLCLINPKILSSSGEFAVDEGCLSFPDIFAKVKRSANVTVEYYSEDGTCNKLDAEGILAVCIQHEIDHLDGITFFDRLSSLKKKLLRNKINKLRDQVL